MINADAPYTIHDTLRELIQDNRRLLMVISRFGISLHHANRKVGELEECAGVHPGTFLCVANMISGKPYDDSSVELRSLTNYLKSAHSYFLGFFLPGIRRKLLEAFDFGNEPELAIAVLRFYDDYAGEVNRHMNYENGTLFAYIDSILCGNRNEDYSIGIFAEHHDAVSHKLRRLKDVLIRYAPESNVDQVNAILFDIISGEEDLDSHCMVEDRILVPAVRKAEALLPALTKEPTESEISGPEEEGYILGKREREIIALVAKGLSNKEIAEKLCISVHTVATHRRNICSKLEIHSSAGLTVYAILNGIVDIKDLDL